MTWARTRKEEELAQLLASGVTQEAAARATGLSTRTIRRRLDDPGFVDFVRELRSEVLSEATGKAASLVIEALDAMGALLHADSELVRLRAAQAVVSAAHELVSRSEVGDELNELRRDMGLDPQR